MRLSLLTTRQAKLDSTKAFEALERATELPLLLLALAIIPLLLLPTFSSSHRPPSIVTVLDRAVWAVFGIELVVKTYLAPRRLAYLRGHWYDV